MFTRKERPADIRRPAHPEGRHGGGSMKLRIQTKLGAGFFKRMRTGFMGSALLPGSFDALAVFSVRRRRLLRQDPFTGLAAFAALAVLTLFTALPVFTAAAAFHAAPSSEPVAAGASGGRLAASPSEPVLAAAASGGQLAAVYRDGALRVTVPLDEGASSSLPAKSALQ